MSHAMLNHVNHLTNVKPNLGSYLSNWQDTHAKTPFSAELKQTLLALASASSQIAKNLHSGSAYIGEAGSRNNSTTIKAHDLYAKALASAPVAAVASTKTENINILDDTKSLAVTLDPLNADFSPDTNMAVTTIFSILPFLKCSNQNVSFLQKGRAQLAAGCIIFGPQTLLLLTTGNGTQCFRYSNKQQEFVLHKENMRVPASWSNTAKQFSKIPQANSLAIDIYGLLTQGGANCYPVDAGDSNEVNKLPVKLITQANPLAFLMQQADGLSSNGHLPILEIKPNRLQQNSRLICGSSEAFLFLHTNLAYAKPIDNGTLLEHEPVLKKIVA